MERPCLNDQDVFPDDAVLVRKKTDLQAVKELIGIKLKDGIVLENYGHM